MTLAARLKLLLPAAAFVLAGWIGLPSAEASVVVLTNRTAAKVDFTIAQADGKTSRHSLAPGDVVPIDATPKTVVSFTADGEFRRYLLRPNSICFFRKRDEKLEFGRQALAGDANNEARPAEKDRKLAAVCTIPVMLLVDEDEPAVRRIWEGRLRTRLEKASKIVARHCRVRFEVAAIGTWVSDDDEHDFEKALRGFELTVHPAPARLAIGFTSQYQIPKGRKRPGRTHLGGTREPLHPHILIREWAQHVTEPERLEILIHELGHFLGATHSAEGDSVMRPVLGDHRSHARSFRIGFDPVNTLIMNLVGEELRAGRWVRGFVGIRSDTRAELRRAYTAMAGVFPEDPSAKNYIMLLDRLPTTRRQPQKQPKPLVEATQAIVRAISEAAEENHRLPPPSAAVVRSSTRLEGDRLMEHYVRRAAIAAAGVRDDVAADAFLLGLGIALDDSATFRYVPSASGLCQQVESNQLHRKRMAVLGSPTMHGRRDLAKHFVVSCALTVLLGPRAAEAAAVGKELADSRGRSGFSFVDLSADLAGTTFATEVRDSRIELSRLASSFAVTDFLPEGKGLEEGIAWEDFFREYRSAQGQRYKLRQAAIRERIRALPGYSQTRATSGSAEREDAVRTRLP